MSTEQITIKEIVYMNDEVGNYGPQKKIVFVDSTDRKVSGWVPMDLFDDGDWFNGNTIDLIITKNKQYTNFKIPRKASSSSTPKGPSLSDRLADLEDRVARLESSSGYAQQVLKTPQEESDVPF